MVSFIEVDKAAKKLAEEEFFNSHYMSVSVGANFELVVNVFKKIRTDNLPVVFEGHRVIYKVQEARMAK